MSSDYPRMRRENRTIEAMIRLYCRGHHESTGELCVECRELLECDIGTPEGLEAAKEKDLFNVLCPKLVRDAAEIIEQIL